MKLIKKEVYSYKGSRKPLWLKIILALILIGAIIFGVAYAMVMGGSVSRMEDESHIMVILGCRVMPWGPSILLQDRLDAALEYLQENPDMTVVVTGGQGDNEPMSEAQAMYEYLTSHGIPAEQILMEDQSTSTLENLRNASALLYQQGYDTTEEILVVTNDFHLTRTRMLFKRVWGGDYNLNTLAAPTSHLPSRMKMYIREPLALIKSALLDH